MRYECLDDWLGWLEQQHPQQIKLGLDRVSRVWRRLHPKGLDCQVITVAGTNGKGSSVAMLEAIFTAAGYRTGCYTSPHLRSYNERIRIAGEPVGDASICTSFHNIDQARRKVRLTYFEFGTLAALQLFAEQGLDVVVLEVGLGGRLDAVNIIDPTVALVTTVALDHTQWLGNDRESIGREKAGIFRAGRPAVYGAADPPQSLLERASELGLPLFRAGRDYDYQRQPTGWDWQGPGSQRTALPLPSLGGEYQLQNAAAVLMVLELVYAWLPVNQAAVRQGLANVALEGRLQVVPGEVTTILDVAHNTQAAGKLVRALDSLPNSGRTLAVFGIMADKEIPALLGIIAPAVDAWYLTDLPVARAMPVQALAAALKSAGIDTPTATYPAPATAFDAARKASRSGDRILVFGSFLTVGEVLSQV